MANEITFSASLSFFKPSIMNNAVGHSVQSATFTVTGSAYAEGSLQVATSATLIPLGQVTAPHWAYFKNLDANNFVSLRNGVASPDLVKLKPGESAFFPLNDLVALYAIADTGPCRLEYLIVSL